MRHAREVMDLNASQALAICNLFGFLHGLQKQNAIMLQPGQLRRLMGNDRKHVGLLQAVAAAAGSNALDMRGTKVACKRSTTGPKVCCWSTGMSPSPHRGEVPARRG